MSDYSASTSARFPAPTSLPYLVSRRSAVPVSGDVLSASLTTEIPSSSTSSASFFQPAPLPIPVDSTPFNPLSFLNDGHWEDSPAAPQTASVLPPSPVLSQLPTELPKLNSGKRQDAPNNLQTLASPLRRRSFSRESIGSQDSQESQSQSHTHTHVLVPLSPTSTSHFGELSLETSINSLPPKSTIHPWCITTGFSGDPGMSPARRIPTQPKTLLSFLKQELKTPFLASKEDLETLVKKINNHFAISKDVHTIKAQKVFQELFADINKEVEALKNAGYIDPSPYFYPALVKSMYHFLCLKNKFKSAAKSSGITPDVLANLLEKQTDFLKSLRTFFFRSIDLGDAANQKIKKIITSVIGKLNLYKVLSLSSSEIDSQKVATYFELYLKHQLSSKLQKTSHSNGFTVAQEDQINSLLGEMSDNFLNTLILNAIDTFTKNTSVDASNIDKNKIFFSNLSLAWLNLKDQISPLSESHTIFKSNTIWKALLEGLSEEELIQQFGVETKVILDRQADGQPSTSSNNELEELLKTHGWQFPT